jgi:subtilisin family serine protease
MTEGSAPTGPTGASLGPQGIETTGNYLVLLADDAIQEGVSAIRDSAGLQIEATVQAEGGIDVQEVADADSVLFEKLGVAVVKPEPDQVGALAVTSHENAAVLAVEPERVVYVADQTALQNEIAAPQAGAISPEYLRGYRDAIDALLHSVEGAAGSDGAAAAPQVFDESAVTWGLQATKVVNSLFSGRGVRVAVLDTGLDLGHPDLVGRSIASASFVPGEEVQDGHGHGTHCIGTACGPKQPAHLPRYGIAYEAEIYAGKVLSNRGSGTDRGILAGISWAIMNHCRIVSMSLGAPVQVGTPYSRVFETVARRALRAGTAIFAAAGNESDRRIGQISPVGHPANCPSILAVAALDSQMGIAWFSNRGINPDGGQVDIAGPGVRVYSSWPRPAQYNTISGTSMATPHVAGIAALYSQADPTVSAGELGCLMGRMARRLMLSSADVGAGLVQAP